MKILLTIFAFLLCLNSFGQTQKVKPPSYFGLQVRPVFPTRFIGSPTMTHSKDGFETTITQKMGYSFGGTVRVGLTKLIALETGINFTQRNFQIDFAVPDSNIYGSDDMAFIEYDVPLNALFYIRLADRWYMNASLGLAITYRPTHVGIYNTPQGYNEFSHFGLVEHKVYADANANVGFEFRTEKKGFFYIGGSARVPFAPLFNLLSKYKWQGNLIQMYDPVDGSFLALDFKYFFPIIKNKGPQFNEGPIR